MNEQSVTLAPQAARRASIWQRGLAWARGSARGTRSTRLDELSDAALRDLGLARCEIGSVQAEAAGRIEATRLRILQPRGAR